MEEAPSSGSVSFDEFASSELQHVLALALALLRDEDEALDVAQETMLRALERWDTVSAFDRPGAWTRRVALNLVTDRLRSRTRSYRLLDRLRARPARSTADVADGAWDEAFWSEVGRLSTRPRNAIVLHYVHDLPIAEIAEILELPVGTVKSDLARARARLSRRLEPPP